MLTIKDLQMIFNCGKRQAYELLHIPGFPAMKLGGKYLISAKALIAGYRRTQEDDYQMTAGEAGRWPASPSCLYRVQQSVQTGREPSARGFGDRCSTN